MVSAQLLQAHLLYRKELAVEVAICASQGWREVQRELLYLVCNYLDQEAQWAMRHVSPQWRESIDQLEGQKLSLKTTAQNLGSKIATLHKWRQSGKLCCCSLDFPLPIPVFLKDLARLLEDLTNQVAIFQPHYLCFTMYHMPSHSCI